MPIIALTANAMQQDRDDCLSAGMDDHLAKPYSRLQMRAVLERWLPAESAGAQPPGGNARDERHLAAQTSRAFTVNSHG